MVGVMAMVRVRVRVRLRLRLRLVVGVRVRVRGVMPVYLVPLHNGISRALPLSLSLSPLPLPLPPFPPLPAGQPCDDGGSGIACSARISHCRRPDQLGGVGSHPDVG